MLKPTLSIAVLFSLLISCMPAPAAATWEGDPAISTAEDAVLAAEAREGYTRFTLTTARNPIDRVQWLVTGENVTIGALEPREVSNGVVADVSGARTVHRLTATGNDLCIKATFSFVGSNRPLFLEACEPELLALASNEERQGSLKPPGDYSLRGNPNFSEAALNPEARAWYEKLWVSLEHPDNYSWATSQAASDNLYNYARGLHTHLQTLLTVFRITGDLALLDEIDRTTEVMRSHLADGWRDTRDGSGRQRDGYLNWVWRNDPSQRNLFGKDTHEVDDLRTHTIIAQIAWALELNRDLSSPSGVDYSERAYFWKDYLVNHFEAKWRSRKQEPNPLIYLSASGHALISKISLLYYMNMIRANKAYQAEAERLSKHVVHELRSITTAAGGAYVWRRGFINLNERHDFLMPTTYARYVMADAVDLHFEGFHRWANTEVPVGFANTLAQLMMDNGATDLARDVGGGVERAGYDPSPKRDWNRMRADIYIISPFALLSPWDSSGKVARISEEMFENVTGGSHQYRVYVPAGMFLYEMLR